MPRSRRQSSDFSTRLLVRCAACWAVPLLFAVLQIATLREDVDHSPWSDSAALALGGIFLMSGLGVTANCMVDCGPAFLLCNMILQLLLVYAFFSGPIPDPPAVEKVPSRIPAGPPLPEREPAPVSRLRGATGSSPLQPGRISVVLPCLNESEFAIKTVQSFCNRTPSSLLAEIIVVDDGSWPPLEIELRQRVDAACRLRVLRHEDGPRGLMIAKQTGGDAAIGDFIGFYDCHVAPRRGWHEETIRLLKAKSRRLVIPMIGGLDIDTWDEIPNGGFVGKCWVNFNADWWWYDDDSDYTPVISGGLVATTREWWKESGGFDPGMHGWGGENTEQPIRTWLCGGDVMRARSSIVAHMWRTEADKRTIARYKIRQKYDNVARTAVAWFDEFLPKFRSGDVPSVNVSQTLELKKRLGCKPFAYFLHRFRKIYLDSGMLPERVFRIRSRSTGLCLQRRNKEYVLFNCQAGTWFHRGNMVPEKFPTPDSLESLSSNRPREDKLVNCGGHQAKGGCHACPQGHGSEWCNADCTWVFAVCMAKEEASKVESQRPETCCSGIREWNSLDCWAGLGGNGPGTALCDITGHSTDQQFIFDDSGRIWHGSGECLGVKDKHQLKKGQCSTAEQWEMVEEFEPLETKLYKQAVVKYALPEDAPDH